MEQIGFLAVAMYARGIGEEDAHIVEHGGLFDEMAVELHFRVLVGNVQCPFGHLPAVQQQQIMQRFVVRIVSFDYFYRVHVVF